MNEGNAARAMPRNRITRAIEIYRFSGWPAIKHRLLREWRPCAAFLDRPWMKWSWVLPGPASDRRLRVFAQRRSGHHAVLNWIRHQTAGRHCLLNECRAGESPVASCSRGNSLVRGWAGEHAYLDWERELAGRHAKKGTLIYNYEDCDFRTMADVTESRESEWLGASPWSQDVLILRDPFNLFASRLRWAHGSRQPPPRESFPEARELWKVYAKEFLSETRHLRQPVCVSYNHWFQSREYRDELGVKLGFVNRDVGLDEVAKWGPTTWGDSFDGLRYDGRAREMKVLERWKEYGHDPFLRELLADPELRELSGRIYGDDFVTE